jgi:DUF971 family protein
METIFQKMMQVTGWNRGKLENAITTLEVNRNLKFLGFDDTHDDHRTGIFTFDFLGDDGESLGVRGYFTLKEMEEFGRV